MLISKRRFRSGLAGLQSGYDEKRIKREISLLYELNRICGEGMTRRESSVYSRKEISSRYGLKKV